MYRVTEYNIHAKDGYKSEIFRIVENDLFTTNGNILLANNYSKESVFTILFREFVKNYSCIFAGQENVNMARSLHTDHKSRKKIFSNTIACSVRPSLNCRDKFSTTNNTPTRLDLHKKGINYT